MSVPRQQPHAIAKAKRMMAPIRLQINEPSPPRIIEKFDWWTLDMLALSASERKRNKARAARKARKS